jgi:hypothetical protein
MRSVFDRAEQHYRAQLGVPPVAANGRFSERLQTIVRAATDTPPSSGNTLVIRSSDMSPDAQANLEEDLAVMSRILDKALEQVPSRFRATTAMGINLTFAPESGTRLRSFYIEEYGALFLLHVGFPLLPPTVTAAEKKEKEAADPAWEEAKQELYGQRPGIGMPGGPIEEFSQEKVNKLKEALLDSLKSAANIRKLKTDDSVTVCVFGAPGGEQGLYGSGGGFGPDAPLMGPGRPVEPRGSVMTIRVKQADVDSFAKGKMDLDQFQKQARIEIYPSGGVPRGAGAGMGGGGGGLGGGTRF